MAPQQNARHEGWAKDANANDRRPAGPGQPRRPRPDELKARIDPAAFYAREIDSAPTLKAKRGGWSQNIACPFHTDPNPSFGVNLQSGAFRCFGCEAQGGSVLDFVMLRDGLDLDGGRAALAERYGVTAGEVPASRAPRKPRPEVPRDPKPEPVARIPHEALASRPKVHPKHGAPSATWTYTDAAGRPLAFVLRFDPAEGRKVFAPLTWTEAGGWSWKAPPEPRPLYGLDRLAARPDAPALICEGEKAADAAASLLPDAVPLGTWGGAQAPRKADFGPLAGRRVLIWPDADAPGASYAATVAELVRAAGAVSVEVLDLASLARDPASGEPRDLPKGWDAADALADGWNPEALAAARWVPSRSEARPRAPEPAESDPQESEAPELPKPFELWPGGVYYQKPPGSKGGGDVPPLWICPPFRVLAVTRDEIGGEFGRSVEFRDLDGNPRRDVIADRERQGSGDILRARLAALGFEVSNHTEARRLFLELLRRWTPETRARSVTRTGWTTDGAAFVLPDRVIGEGPEPVILAAEGERPAFGTRGTPADWRERVGRLCVGNSRLLFCVSLAFAPPLLRLIGGESGGFHLVGSSTDASSTGKTTVQRVAASVFGPPDYLQRWRTTDNALEGLAETHSDALLILDELNQLDPKAAGASAYLLANGSGKARMDRDAGSRPRKRWRLLFLSSGEEGLAQFMASVQRRAKAGQEVRMAELPADGGAGHGVFEALHDHGDGAAFAVALADGAAAAHGAPWLDWVAFVVRERAALPPLVKRLQGEFVAGVLAGVKNPPGQVRRVAGRFGLVAVAGELASGEGITGWPPGAAHDAAARCFRDWLAARGGAEPGEERELLAQVRLFFEQNSNRFRWKNRALDDHAPEVPKQVGFKDDPSDELGGLLFYAFPQSYRSEIVAGFDPKDAARVLIRHGWLKPGEDGRATRKERLPGFKGTQRVYVFVRPSEGDEGGEHGH